LAVHVGILGGTGPAGSALAARLASVGYEVTIGSRSEQRARDISAEVRDRWPERDLELAGSDNLAAASRDVVVVATPWDSAATTAATLADELAGKVVISMGNALIKVGRELQPLALARGSVAASVQAVLPDSMVAAAFQHVPATDLADLDKQVDSDVLICSDHAAATAAVAEMTARIPGLRALDAGPLANAGAIESFVAVIIGLNIRYRTRAAVRITGVEL
jgi:NADPH-dependent F420 reductase